MRLRSPGSWRVTLQHADSDRWFSGYCTVVAAERDSTYAATRVALGLSSSRSFVVSHVAPVMRIRRILP